MESVISNSTRLEFYVVQQMVGFTMSNFLQASQCSIVSFVIGWNCDVDIIVQLRNGLLRQKCFILLSDFLSYQQYIFMNGHFGRWGFVHWFCRFLECFWYFLLYYYGIILNIYKWARTIWLIFMSNFQSKNRWALLLKSWKNSTLTLNSSIRGWSIL